jgi:hypothetical protein
MERAMQHGKTGIKAGFPMLAMTDSIKHFTGFDISG